MDRVITFQCDDESLTFSEVGDKLRDALVASFIQHGFRVLSDDSYDPDWPIRMLDGDREFKVILVLLDLSPSGWSISLEDLNYQFLDDVELQARLNPIIQETMLALPNVINIVWYNDFQFRQSK